MKLPAPLTSDEGFSEQYRKDLHTVPLVHRLLSLMQVTPAYRLDGFDVYHGNAISDPKLIPPYQVAVHKLTEGVTFVDTACANRLLIFAQQGIAMRGVYHWLRSDSPVLAQWNFFNKQLIAMGLVKDGKLIPGILLMLDWERTYKTPTTSIPDPSGAYAEEFVRLARAAYGNRICVYSAEWVPDFVAWRKDNPDVPVWYACYAQSVAQDKAAKYKSMCLQYTNKALVPGFTNPVDGNMIIDHAQLREIAGLNVATEPPPKPTPTPPVPTPTPPVPTPTPTPVVPTAVILPVTPNPLSNREIMIGIVANKSQYDAQFIGTYVPKDDGEAIFLNLEWINTAKKVNVAAAHQANGAKVFAYPPEWLANCWVDKVPTGDHISWVGVFANDDGQGNLV